MAARRAVRGRPSPWWGSWALAAGLGVPSLGVGLGLGPALFVGAERSAAAAETSRGSLYVSLGWELELGEAPLRRRFGSYEVAIEREGADARLSISRAGTGFAVGDAEREVLFSAVAAGFRFAAAYGDDDAPPSIGPIDLTGRGRAELVVSAWTGAGRAAHTIHVFELGAELVHVAALEQGHSELAHFEDLDGDGALELVTRDRSFGCWEYPGAEAPAPEVVLRFERGAFRPAWDLMARRAGSGDALAAEARAFARAPGWAPGVAPAAVAERALDLIYGGHMSAGLQLIDAAWPQEVSGRVSFKASLLAQLARSPYAGDLVASSKK